jgi:hypothetical protein
MFWLQLVGFCSFRLIIFKSAGLSILWKSRTLLENALNPYVEGNVMDSVLREEMRISKQQCVGE